MSQSHKFWGSSKGVNRWFQPTTKAILPTITLLLILAWFPACSREQQPTENNPAKPKIVSDEQIGAFARVNQCVLLSDEIAKATGTNQPLSFNIQRVFNSNKRIAANCRLNDLVQSGEQIKAILEISDFDLGLWSLHGARKCVAELECPSNLIAALSSKQDADLCIAFEPSENHHQLSITTHADGDDESVVASGIITVTGKLIAIYSDGSAAE